MHYGNRTKSLKDGFSGISLGNANITKYILNRLHPDNILITQGVVDALDHSSPKFARGGKLGIDCTGDEIEHLGITLLSDEELLSKVQQISDEVTALRQYETDTKNPICVIKTKKTRNQKYLIEDLKQLSEYIKILIIVDDEKNDVNNPYMLIWRVVNNIDASRDIYVINNLIAIDGTNKNKLDNSIKNNVINMIEYNTRIATLEDIDEIFKIEKLCFDSSDAFPK